jgi:GntR family transcriptional regulator
MRRSLRYDRSVPLHFQVEMLLRRRCEEQLRPGHRLPSEPVLCREYQVSRSTLRRALDALQTDRVIRRERGRGTFVSDEPLGVQVRKLTGSLSNLVTHGLATHAKVHVAKPVLAGRRVAQILQVREGSVVAHVARVRYVDQRPLAYTKGYLPLDPGARVLEEDLERRSILHILTNKYRMPVPEAEQTVEAIVADPELAEHLGIRAGAPVLKIERVFFTRKRRPVYYTDSCYRADRYKFGVVLNRRETDRGPTLSLLQGATGP